VQFLKFGQTLNFLKWFFALAALSVGLKNFELGLTVDGPLYATIARGIAESTSSSWWLLKSQIPEFQPYFAEHPHLGFWVLAFFFRVLGTVDWVARMPSHLFYLAILILFYKWSLSHHRSERASTLAIILIWISPVISSYSSNAYLDAQCFFFGAWAVYAFDRGTRLPSQAFWVAMAGLALGACALTKGLTVLGFGPVMAYLVFSRLRSAPREILLRTIFCLTSFVGVLGLYSFLLSQSEVPDFLTTYFHRQWTNRFAQSWDWSLFWNSSFYRKYAKETGFLIFIVPLLCFVFRRRLRRYFLQHIPKRDVWLLPLISILSFLLMYVPSDLLGFQYWIMILPWTYWILGWLLDALLFNFKPDAVLLKKITFVFAILATFVGQYTPIQVRKVKAPALAVELGKNEPVLLNQRLWLEEPVAGLRDPFIYSGTWAWYTQRPVSYVKRENLLDGSFQIPPNDLIVLNVQAETLFELDSQLRSLGFCFRAHHTNKGAWRRCVGDSKGHSRT
jgi:4-amino-4-deoxy-L-arabinose transferase-like glycosyltransferase